jgi:hypothetical protein
MKGKAVFVAPLHGIECEGLVSKRGFELEDDLYLSSDGGYYDALISRHFSDSLDLRFRVYMHELKLEGAAHRPFLHAEWELADDALDLGSHAAG